MPAGRSKDHSALHYKKSIYEKARTKIKTHYEPVVFNLSLAGIFCAIQLICRNRGLNQ